jgi:hypothetical protein
MEPSGYDVPKDLALRSAALLDVGILMAILGFLLTWTRPVLGSFLLSLGLASVCLGLFFRPGKQTEGVGCAFFIGYVLLGTFALVVALYGLIANIIH